MSGFLKPQWVVALWSEYLQDYQYLCTNNSHFVMQRYADRFWSKMSAKAALNDYLNRYGRNSSLGYLSYLEENIIVLNLSELDD